MKRAWRRWIAGLFLVPALAEGSFTLFAQQPVTTVPAATSPADARDGAKALIKQGRVFLQANNIAGAKQCAEFAAQMNVKWEFYDDKPEMLLADIAKHSSAAPNTLPPMTSVPPLTVPETPAAKPAAVWPTNAKTLMRMGRDALKSGNMDLARECARRAAACNYRWGLIEDKPERLLSDIDKVARATPPRANNVVNTGGMSGAAPTPGVLPASATSVPPVSPQRQQAVMLMAECRQYQKAGRLVDARAKALEAQKLGVDFGPNEDTPDRALLELSSQASAHIEIAIQQAMTHAGATPTPEAAARAQAVLVQAKQLAQDMGLSALTIDEKYNTLASHTIPPKPATPPAPPPLSGRTQGEDMLRKAQLELRNGNMSGARQLAESVFVGSYGMQSEANALLRSIEAEEHNQKILAATHAYDAGMQAFTHGDYGKCVNIFLQIDGTLLTPDKRESMRQKMQEAGKLASGRPAASPMVPPMPAAPESPITPAKPPVVATHPTPPAMPLPTLTSGQSEPGTARVGDMGVKSGDPIPGVPSPSAPAAPTAAGADNYAQQMKALQQIEFQRQREEGLKAQREASARFAKGETDAALQVLSDYLDKLKSAPLDKTQLEMLKRPVEFRYQSLKVLKAQKDAEVSLALRGQKLRDKQAARVEAEEAKFKQVAELMKQFHKLMDDGKFKEAEMTAMKAAELDPDADAPKMALKLALMNYRKDAVDKDKASKEKFWWEGMRETDNLGPNVAGDTPVRFGDRWRETEERARGDGSYRMHRTEREREIDRRLSTPVSVDFQGTTLSRALEDLKVMTKLNIVPMHDAINDENPKALGQPVSLRVDAVPLKSVLKILLNQVKLTYVIADDVLQVTTDKGARGKLVQKVYSVADLVIPIDNFSIPNQANLMKVFEMQRQDTSGVKGLTTAYQPQNGLTAGQTVGTNSMSTTPGTPMPGGANPAGPMASSSFQTLNKNTLEDVLKKLIVNVVSPQSWGDVGGPGTIDYFPIGMALVINQTPDVQEQVQELLQALRRLQDLEVAVECRIVTVAETFFERIGMDFALNFKTDGNTDRIEPQLVTGQFKPNGFFNDRNWRGVVTGLTPAGTLTSDLDIPLKATSFNMAIPPFAYPNMPGSQGGLSLGLAFLNDIEVFMFMEAAQGDRRTNVMQAPKLTLFNGQTSTVEVQDFQFFVTGVTVASVNGQIVFVPQNQPFPVGQSGLGLTGAGGVGIQMTIQAVVSADRRYVRLSLTQNLSSLASATVPLFPVTTFVTPTFEGGFVGQPIPFTQFIQQPRFSFVGVQTTVSVPDGGTVLLGGLKTLSEGRNEFGPPILSKIPYLNRLVKNTGYGREAQHMMLMVTPRIIINSEEAERQTGEQIGPPN
jgi:type II secretory pathway component GspD/PulD (secretin)